MKWVEKRQEIIEARRVIFFHFLFRSLSLSHTLIVFRSLYRMCAVFVGILMPRYEFCLSFQIEWNSFVRRKENSPLACIAGYLYHIVSLLIHSSALVCVYVCGVSAFSCICECKVCISAELLIQIHCRLHLFR